MQLFFDFPKSANYTFDNFAVCAGNDIAYKSAISFCTETALSRKSLFFYGDKGVGKTHILRAVGNHFPQNSLNFKIIYISTGKLISFYSGASSYKEILQLSETYKSVDLLLLDDIHEIECNKDMQDQIFHIYNELIEKGNRIIIAGRKSPVDMPSVQKHLQSRLLHEPVIQMEVRDDEARKKILKKISSDESVILTDDVVKYLLTHFSRDIADFQMIFSKLNSHSLRTKRKISISLIKEALA